MKKIRILDKENIVVKIELSDILREISKGESYDWSILYLYASGDLGKNESIPSFEKQIYDSEKGFFVDWKDLNILSKKFYQIIDLLLIGCKDKSFLNRYENDQQMYENCDIVIEMIDSSYWEVFSKDEELINKLAKKFKEVEFLTLNFT